MSEWKKYQRKGLSEMRPYVAGEVLRMDVSISDADLKDGSPKIGDMIARNPKNHNDQWLVAKKYFEENLEEANAFQANGNDNNLSIEPPKKTGELCFQFHDNEPQVIVDVLDHGAIKLELKRDVDTLPNEQTSLLFQDDHGNSFALLIRDAE